MKSCFDNWSDVRVFLAVYREGSTLAASRVLGVAQPTVARRIDALEHALGLTLFERDTRGFKPTAWATELIDKAEAVEAAARALSEEASALLAPRTIRITAISENLSARTIALVSDFSDAHPGVHFEFLPGAAVADLMGGEADIALRLSFTEPDPSLIRRKISTAKFAIYGTQAYAEKHGLPRSVDDLDGHKFVSFNREDAPALIHDWMMDHVSPSQIVRVCSEVALMTADIQAGRTLGLVNLRMAADFPDFIQCFDPPKELDTEHLLLVSPAAWRRPEVKSFVRYFAPRYAAMYK